MAGTEEGDLPGGEPTQRQPRRQPAAPPPARPRPTAEELLGHYELEDEGDFDPELDAAPDYERPPRPPAGESAAARPTKRPPDAGAAGSTPPPAPKHPARLVRMAEDFGIPKEEIDATPTETLEGIVYGMHRAVMQHQQELRARPTDRRGERATPRGGESPAAARPEPPEPEEPPTDWSQYDPAVQKLAKTVDQLLARNKAIEEQFGPLAETVVRREADDYNGRIDDAFASLGEDAERYFGRGSYTEVTKDQHRRRLAVLQAAGIDWNSRPSGRDIQSRLAAAFDLLYGGDEPPAPAAGNAPYAAAGVPPGREPPQRPAAARRQAPPQSPARRSRPTHPVTGRYLSDDEIEQLERQEAWVAAGTQQPTQRKAKDLPHGDRRAKLGVKAWQERNGYAGEGPGVDEETELPD